MGSDEEGDDNPMEGMNINVLEEDVREANGSSMEGEEPQSPWVDSLARLGIRPPTAGWDAPTDIRGLRVAAQLHTSTARRYPQTWPPSDTTYCYPRIHLGTTGGAFMLGEIHNIWEGTSP